MRFEVLRVHTSEDFTSGLLYKVDGNNREFLAYTLEDEAREVKIKHETRIDSGSYKLSLQKAGRFHTKYKAKFADKGADWWQGSILVNDVPKFSGILWHIGNKNSATSGCLLVGLDQQFTDWVGRSTDAFVKIYPIVRDAILSQDEVWVDYIDYDGEMINNKSTNHPINTGSVEEKLEELKKEIKELKSKMRSLEVLLLKNKPL
mgnify:FL=1|tara:strand:+ start:1789 stop:2400 length:612 start_codon:yes stop_codon:yes gene_type:complete